MSKRTFVCNSSEPIVQTKVGRIRGFIKDGTYTFHGIKYANAKRFQAPVPVEPWEGVKDALSYGYISPLLDDPRPDGDIMIPHRFWPESEHCQYINIWTSTCDTAAKKPVMVWLHGGGFEAGSSLEMVAYEGENLCVNGDVVVVSLNHRLNILGFLDMSSYSEKYANSGNAGMEDIVVALEWVRNNIAFFGGDPENVTIFGQSGGGMKVTALCQIPAAYGLFHKAIVMSGVADIPMGGSRDDRVIIDALVAELGLKSAEELETVPFSQLKFAHKKITKKLRKEGKFAMWGPLPNDWYAGDPLQVGFTDYAKTIPTIVGTVIAEFGFMPSVPNKHKLSTAERREILLKTYKEHTDKLIELFKKAYPGKNELDIMYLDTMFRLPSLRYIDEKSSFHQAPVYSYMFSLEFDYDDGKPAWHCADIPFFFHNTDMVAICAIEGVTEKLEKQMFGSFVSFAKTGSPNHPSLPEWRQYTTSDKATMVFDRECEIRVDYEKELLSLLKEATAPFDMLKLAMDED